MPLYDIYCQDRLVATCAKYRLALDWIRDFPYNGGAYFQSDFRIVERDDEHATS